MPPSGKRQGYLPCCFRLVQKTRMADDVVQQVVMRMLLAHQPKAFCDTMDRLSNNASSGNPSSTN